MAFTLPNFNLSVDVWIQGNSPAAGPFDFSIIAQMYLGRDEYLFTGFGPSVGVSQSIVPEWRFPPSLIIPGIPLLVTGFISYVDSAGVARFYLIQSWEWKHAGFLNEYIAVYAPQCDFFGAVPDTSR